MLQNEKQFPEAALVWKQLADVTKDESVYSLRLNAAQCYYQAKNFIDAKMLSAQLISASNAPDDVIKHALLLQCRIALDAEKNYADALKCLTALADRTQSVEKFNYLCTLAALNLQLKRTDDAIASYRAALEISDAPSADRAKVLLQLTYLELLQSQYDAALEHAGALFACSPQPAIPTGLLNNIAKIATNAGKTKLAQDAWLRIIDSADAQESLKQKSRLQLAESYLPDTPENAQQHLAQFANASELSPDAEALFAEIAVSQKHYDRAFMHANRALGSAQNAILEKTAARALWAKAYALHEGDHASKQALDFAIPCFVMYEKCEPYASNCRKLAIEIYRAIGDEKNAVSLEREVGEEQ